MEELTKFISNVGFPIFVAVAMLYQNYTVSTATQKMMDEFRNTIEENTKAMEELINKVKEGSQK